MRAKGSNRLLLKVGPLLLASNITAQQDKEPRSVPAESVIERPTGIVRYIDTVWFPADVHDYVSKSDHIVEGEVASVFPAVRTAPRSHVTDIIVRVIRSFTDSKLTPELVVSQEGGTVDNFRIEVAGQIPIEPGQRYIFFLAQPSPQRLAVLPSRPGFSRYDVLGGVRIEGNVLKFEQIHSPRFRARYEGSTPEQIVDEIRSALKRR